MRSHYVEFSSLFVCFSSAMCVRTLLYAPVPSTQLAFLTFIHEHWFGFIEKWILYLMHGCTVAWAVSEISIKKWSNENYSGENKMEKEKKRESPGSSMRRTAFLSPYLVNSCLWWIYQIWFISLLIFHIASEYILLQSDVIAYCCLQMHTCTDMHTHMHTRGKRKFLPEGGQSNLAVSWCSNQQWQADQLHQLIM